MGTHQHYGQIPQSDVNGLTTALAGKADSGAAPTTHAASHASGGSDPVTPAAIGALATTAKGAASGVGSLTSASRQTSSEIPIVRHQIRTGSVTTSVTSDAGSGAGNLVNITTNGAITVNPPTNPVDWQEFDHHFVAVGADRTVTFAGGYVTAGPSLGPWTVPRGKVLVTRSEYIGNRATSADAAAPAWALVSAGVTDALTPPNLHATTHASGGTDPVTPAAIGAATSGHTHTAAGVGAVAQLTERAVSASVTAVSGEFVFVTAGSSTKQVTLPAATVGATVGVKKADTGAGVVLVAAAGTDTWVNGGNASRQLNIQDEQVIAYCYQAGQWTTVDQGFSTYWGDSRYAPQTRSISTGTGLTGGGNLQADRTLAVSFGSTSTTVAAGDHAHASAYQPLDSDLTAIAALTATTDNVIQSVGSAWASRTPAQLKATLALAKGDVGLGNVDNTADTAKPISTATQTALDAKQPKAPVIFSLSNVAGGGTISIDASQGDICRVTTTGTTATLAVPTNATDGDPINLEVTTSGNALTLSLNASIVNCSGATAPFSVGSGKKAFIGLRPISSTWYLLAYSVEP